jgi:hyaluronan synthase
VIITVDSDSTIEKDAISEIVKPFNNPKIGAVAGNIRVQNLDEGVIPQMLDIIFVFCYEFLRSSQSRYGTVLCTPGALSAYRREAVIPLLDGWLNQRFCGEYTSIGEDRALTSMLLCREWHVVYQNSATSYTNIPASYSKVCKMLLRWVRGDIRENILMFPYVFRSFSLFDTRRLLLQLHYISFSIGTIAPLFMIPVILVFLVLHFSEITFVLGYALMVMAVWSSIPAMIYAKRCSLKRSLYAFVYGLFSTLLLSWIPVYAALTLNNNKWMTRNR